MRFFRDLSINTKLNLLVAVAAGVATLLAVFVFGSSAYFMIRSMTVRQVSTLGTVLADNVEAAMTFDDPATARELLASLDQQPTIKYACLYRVNKEPFATFGNDPSKEVPDLAEITKAGYRFRGDGTLEYIQPIRSGPNTIGYLLLRASMDEFYDKLRDYINISAIVMIVSITAAVLLSASFQRAISHPILRLAQTALRISTENDYSIRIEKTANDEIGTLYDEFNGMLDQIDRSKRELQQAHSELEQNVQRRTAQLSKTNLELSHEINERKRAQRELAAAHDRLVEAARQAGMAEIATGVLHNVGNVLNSVNVSSILIHDILKESRLSDLERAIRLLRSHDDDLAEYLTEDPKGKLLPSFLSMVSEHIGVEHHTIGDELIALTKNIDHIKTIISMQQAFAGAGGIVEAVDLVELIEDGIKLNLASMEKNGILIIREFEPTPALMLEKQKVFQIVVNLMANAKDALVESGCPRPELRIGLRQHGPRVEISIIDNGIGIARENLTRIFSHGFTTKSHGHGFGLHSSANAAKEMGGRLGAQSDGLGYGATFTLELPFVTSSDESTATETRTAVREKTSNEDDVDVAAQTT